VTQWPPVAPGETPPTWFATCGGGAGTLGVAGGVAPSEANAGILGEGFSVGAGGAATALVIPIGHSQKRSDFCNNTTRCHQVCQQRLATHRATNPNQALWRSRREIDASHLMNAIHSKTKQLVAP
jgi:hypothetical protein